MVKTDNNLGKQIVLLNQLGPMLIGSIRHDEDFNKELANHTLDALKYMVDTLISYAIDKYNLQPLARHKNTIVFGLDDVYLTINQDNLPYVPEVKTLTDDEYNVLRRKLNGYIKYFPEIDLSKTLPLNSWEIFTNGAKSIIQDINIDVLVNLLSELCANADEDMNDLIYIVNYCVDKVIEDCKG